jgi:AraC-like DNA-binding protein
MLRRTPGLGSDPLSAAIRFSPRVVCRLLEHWSGELERKCLGTDFGRGMSDSGLGLVGAAAYTAGSVREALTAALRLLPLQTTAVRVRLVEDLHVARLEWRPLEASLTPHYVEAAFSAWVSLFRTIAAEPVPIHYLTFVHRRRRSGSDFESRYGCPVVFGADANRIVVPREALDIRPRRADAALHQRFTALVGSGWLEDGNAPQGAILGVLNQDWSGLLSGTLRVATLAETQQVARRTMQRRLSDQDMTFRRAVDAVRANYAIGEVLRGELTITQIADGLNFSEQSALTRAFRRWTGLSPRAFRQRMTAIGGTRPS